MTRSVMAALAMVLLGCGCASAQLSGSAPSPLGITSPLGIGPASPVSPTGIPLGSTELGSLGVTPTISGTSPLGPAAAGSLATCAGVDSMAGNLTGTSTGTSTLTTPGSINLFDGGGTMGTASGTCANIATSTSASTASSASSPTGMGAASAVGRVGIPMGSTELGVGGVSPVPQVLVPNPSVPAAALLSNPFLPSASSGTPTLGASCPASGMGGITGC